jgi:hypothetical protein
MIESIHNIIGVGMLGGLGTAVLAMYKLIRIKNRGLDPSFLHWQRLRVLGQGVAIGAVGLKMAANWIFICDEKPLGIIPLLLRSPNRESSI